jgi:hypothetical protein
VSAHDVSDASVAIKYNVAVFRLLAWRTHEFQHGAQALALLWPIADVARCHAQCFAFASNCARAFLPSVVATAMFPKKIGKRATGTDLQAQ